MSISINKSFSYRVPNEESIFKVKLIREATKALANLIEQVCPHSEERARAILDLKSAMMFANSSIVQDCPVDEKEL